MHRMILAGLAALALLGGSVAADTAAAPFGLRWGMTRADFLAAGGTIITEGNTPLGMQAAVANLPKALSDLGSTILLFGPDDALWRVYARSTTWPHDSNGFYVKKRFAELRDNLTARYGKSKDYFVTPSDEFYSRPDKFAYSISQKKRTHASLWEVNDIEIALVVESDYDTTSYVLTYEYKPLAEPVRKGAASKDKEAL